MCVMCVCDEGWDWMLELGSVVGGEALGVVMPLISIDFEGWMTYLLVDHNGLFSWLHHSWNSRDGRRA